MLKLLQPGGQAERLCFPLGQLLRNIHQTVAQHESNVRDAVSNEAEVLDITQMESSTLQVVASLLYPRIELFRSYLSRSEADIAQGLQRSISKIDAGRKELLMRKVAAVSESRATPIILGWVAASIKAQIAEALRKQPRLPAEHRHLVAAARITRTASSSNTKSVSSEEDLVMWLLDPKTELSWEIIMQMPATECLLAACCKSDPKLNLACNVLGLPTSDHEPLHAAITHALADAAANSMELVLTAMQHPADARVPLDILNQASSKSFDQFPSQLSQAAVGLALVQYIGSNMGLYLQPDVQLVTRMLRVSPFDLLSKPAADAATESDNDTGAKAAAAAAAISPKLLDAVVQQLLQWEGLDTAALLSAAAAAAAAPAQHQGTHDPSLAAALKAAASSDPTSPAAQLLSALQAWRKQALLAGVPCIMATATSEEVSALTEEEALSLAATVRALDATGQALEHLVLPAEGPGPSGRAQGADLDMLQSLPAEHRLALAWRVRSPTAARQAAKHLLSALHCSSLRRHRANQKETASYDALVAAFSLEQRVAELDILSDGSKLPPGSGAEQVLASHQERYTAARLPSERELQSRQRHRSPDDAQLFDALLEGEAASEAQVLAAFEALLKVVEEEEEPIAPVQVPETLNLWFSETKMALNKLSPAMLALLRRFLFIKIRVSKADAQEAQQQARLLLQAVQAEIRRADRASSGAGAGGTSRTGRTVSPYWRSLDVVAQQELDTAPAAMSPSGAISAVDPGIVKALLSEPDAKQFSDWLRSSALLQQAPGLQPYDVLAEQHLKMDMERYLQMRHDPELSLSFEQPPRPWREASPLGHGTEEEFLQGMKDSLSSYLSARGLQPLSDIEWETYKQHAVAEFSIVRQAHEEALLEAGHSAFFNSRAEAVFLRSVLERDLPAGSPLHQQAHRYLDTLEANSSWTFAQKKFAVQRLVELSKHFRKQGPVSERGSPFAPLFSGKDGDSSLVPKFPAVKLD